jgi:very-short-patch-repair endonuclease
MRWNTTKDQHDYMKVRQQQNEAKIGSIPAEERAWKMLQSSSLKWRRQAMWGCRLFDFWCAEKGAAIEIDGPNHDPETDAVRDRYNWLRSGIAVLRVRNFDCAGLRKAVAQVVDLAPWNARRTELGLDAPGKRARRKNLTDAGLRLAHGKWVPPPI